jgi:hypothetical protein
MNVKRKMSKFVFWTPRILSIIFTLFLVLFSFDVFGQGYGFWGTVLAFLMHNIPAFILLAVVIISWKREIVGGIAFIAAGLLYIALNLITIIKNGFEWYYVVWIIQISGVAFFIGIMYLVGWYKKKSRTK